MSYTVLARRYRSTNFDELVGQEHIAQTLKKAIESNRLAHAFLFCGTRGTGKTSSARILAKCLNCEKSDKPTASPCGKCTTCLSIAKGEDIDVIEIDAASNTGVDNVRDIIENAQFRPARSRFKVYIIDEVHMLSKSAFNALLKTLEEPPEHVKFILATTEAEKVLPTILSRCQRYDFRNIPTREIAAHLKEICKKEKIKADEEALMLVAKSGAGSMRDALSLLDRLLSVGDGELTTDLIEQMLGLPKSQLLFNLAQVIGEGEVQKTLEQADKLITSGLSTDTLIASLVDHFRNLLILRTCGSKSELVEVPGLPLADLVKQAERFDPVVLSQDIVVMEELRRQLHTSSAGRALIDATLVRLALAEQFSTVEDLLNGASSAPTPGSGEKKKSELDTAADAPVVSVARQDNPPPSQGGAGGGIEEASASEAPEITPAAAEEKDDLPAVGKVWEGAGPVSVFAAFKKSGSSAPKPAARVEEPEPSNLGPVDANDLTSLMRHLRATVQQESPTLVGFLDGGRITGLDDSTATLEYPEQLAMSAKMLDRNGKRESVQSILSNLLGRSVGLKLEIGPPSAEFDRPVAPPPPPSFQRKQNTPEPEAPILQTGIPLTDDLRQDILANNPLIKSLAEQLGARIVKVEEPETPA